MTVTEAMHVASRISYWPAAYASLLTYLRIDQANPAYFSETIRLELKQRSEAVLMREWVHMSSSERLHVAACVIAEEVTGIAEAGPFSADDEDTEGEGHRDTQGPTRNYEVLASAPAPSLSGTADAPNTKYCATSGHRSQSKLLIRLSQAAIVSSAITSLAVIVGCFGIDHAGSVAAGSAGLMVLIFVAGVATEWRR